MLADRIRQESSDMVAMSSRSFMFELGNFIDQEGSEKEKESSFLWNSWHHKIPVFVPALCDSSIGLALTKHYVNSIGKGVKDEKEFVTY